MSHFADAEIELPSVGDLPSVAALPDPFLFMNGSAVQSAQDWSLRREELLALVQYYVFGYRPKPESVTFETSPSPADNLTVTMKQGGREAAIHATVFVPKRGTDTSIEGPYPALIVIGGITEAQRSELLSNGYAVIQLPAAQIYSDNASRTGAYTTLFPYEEGDYEADSGALMAWGWGVSRVLDALEMGAFPDIDPKKAIVTGLSRFGKAALLAGAFDRRIAVTVPVDSGQAGASGFRYNVEGRIYGYTGQPFEGGHKRSEKISNMTGSLRHWFSSRIAEFAGREDKLPFDSHSVMALVAPRPLLIFAGEEFDWLSPTSAAVSYTAAKEVYEFLNAGDAIGLNIRKGPHEILDRDIAIMIDFCNHALRGAELQLSKDKFPFADTYNDSPYPIDSSYIPWSRPGKHTISTATEQIVAGMPADVTAYSDAESVTLEIPGGKLPSVTVPVADGKAVF